MLKSALSAIVLLTFSGMSWGQIPYVVNNPQWPSHCGSLDSLETLYKVDNYLRFYPSVGMAKANSTNPGHLITGLSSNAGIFLYSKNDLPVSNDPTNQEPLPVIVPLWLPTYAIDTEYFKLGRMEGNVTPYSFVPGAPNSVGFPGGGDMTWGGSNYLCIEGFGETVDDHTLTFVQGYIWRNENYGKYLVSWP